MDPFQYYRHLRHTKQYVEEHLTEPIALTDVARGVGLSPTYYSIFFHKATGLPFSVWLRRQRIDRAKKLLRESDQPIYQVAIDVGFGSLSAFERTFRASEFVPPSVYRRINRHGIPGGFADDFERIADNSII